MIGHAPNPGISDSVIFVTWLKVTNNNDCVVQITRMSESRIFDLGNDRIREHRTLEVRARCIPTRDQPNRLGSPRFGPNRSFYVFH